ncbi:MAG: hypothetical protein QOE29_1657 [Gaiellaceae bacterium]|nr:hypothetical protein [Gaiellaceae bacterium]
MKNRMVTALGLLAVAAVVAAVASAATSVSTPVNVTNSQFAANEESLGMDPSGTLLAGAWNDWHYNDGCGFSYSTDGGTTWAAETFVPGMSLFTNDPNVPGTGTFPIVGDPAVAYNPRFGTFDVVCQAFGKKAGQIQLLATTFDHTKADPAADVNFSYGGAVGGAPAWTTPVAITTGKSNGSQKGSNGQLPDHEAIVVDTGTGGLHHYGRLYVAWAEFSGVGRSPINLAYSDDNGASWTGPIRVSDAGHQFDQDATPRIGVDGAVYVSFINGPNEKSTKNNSAMVAKSTDGGTTWGPSMIAAPIPNPTLSLPNAQYRGGTNVTSTVDQGSGKVVVVYDDASTGTLNEYAVHTLAAGDLSSWSAPVRVKASAQTQFFPWLSSAPNGRVDLVYYDRCDAGDTLNCVSLSSSTDSGATWSSVQLLNDGFDGDTFGACLAFVDPPDCKSYFLGDYIAVASTNTKALALWTGNGPATLDVFAGGATFTP